MNIVEAICLWAAIGFYVISFVAAMISVFFRKPGAERFSHYAFPAALALHLVAGIARWIASGHAPVMYSYENSLSGAFFVAAIYLVLFWRLPATRRALPAVIVAVLLILGNGVTNPQPLTPLEPPFRSGWLVVHVSFAWLAFGAYLVASIIAGLYLIGARKAAKAEENEEQQKRLGRLDDSIGRMTAFGFISDTLMLASGAMWAHGLWGRYWGWDPIETWSLVTWLIYGVNLHLRFTMGWSGKRAAWLALFSVLGVIITFFGIGVISDVHTELL